MTFGTSYKNSISRLCNLQAKSVNKINVGLLSVKHVISEISHREP